MFDESLVRKTILEIAEGYINKSVTDQALRKDLIKYMDYPSTGKPGKPQWCCLFSSMCWLKAFDSFEGGNEQIKKLRKAFSYSTKEMIYGWEDKNTKPSINGFFKATDMYNTDILPEPKPGDMIFFRRPSQIRDPEFSKTNKYEFKKQTTLDGSGDKLYNVLTTSGHVGIVYSIVKNDNKISKIITIEGNTSPTKGNESNGNIVGKKEGVVTKGDDILFPSTYWVHRNYFGLIAFITPIIDPSANFQFGDKITTFNTAVRANSNASKKFEIDTGSFSNLVDIVTLKGII